MEMNLKEMAGYYVNDIAGRMRRRTITAAVTFLTTLVVFVLWLLLVKDGASADVMKKFYYAFFGVFAISMYYIWISRANLKGAGEEFFGHENMELFNGLFVVFISFLCFLITEASGRNLVRGAMGLLMLIGMFLLLTDFTGLAIGEIEEAKEMYDDVKRRLEEEKAAKKEAERKLAVKIAEMEDKIDVLEGGISIPTFIRLKNKRSVV